MGPPTDEQLLLASVRDEDAFAAFYRRNVATVAGFFLQRVRDAELAADLTAETFAAALQGRRRYDPAVAPATAWLFGIARHKLSRAYERGRVEDRARRRMRMPSLDFNDCGLDALERAASEAIDGGRVLEALAALPPEQRDAVVARVIAERDYADIAREIRAAGSDPARRPER